MSAPIEIVVVDPGDMPFPNLRVDRSYICPEVQADGYSFKSLPHAWQVVTLGEKSAVWMCTRCRRVERRVFVAEADA